MVGTNIGIKCNNKANRVISVMNLFRTYKGYIKMFYGNLRSTTKKTRGVHAISDVT